MFHYWHRVRDGTMSRREFREWMEPVRERVEQLLERGSALGIRGFSGTCTDILAHRAALWAFVDRTTWNLRTTRPSGTFAPCNVRPGRAVLAEARLNLLIRCPPGVNQKVRYESVDERSEFASVAFSEDGMVRAPTPGSAQARSETNMRRAREISLPMMVIVQSYRRRALG